MTTLNAHTLAKQFKQKHPTSNLENHFYLILVSLGLNREFAQEYKFAEGRKFRFDFADIPNKVAIELNGAVFTQGRHTRGKGYQNDCKKRNLAQCLGWRILEYTSIEDMRLFEKDYTILINQTKQ